MIAKPVPFSAERQAEIAAVKQVIESRIRLAQIGVKPQRPGTYDRRKTTGVVNT